MLIIISLFTGLLFGIGLVVSGMFNPAKVLGFLDVAGKWDPSLALVMAGAVAIGMMFFFIAGKRDRSLTGAPMLLPTANQIDRRLGGGSRTCGIAWGLAGFCPGPALVSLGTGALKGFWFVASMLAGMAIFELIERARISARPQPDVGNP
jgi:uncharacterized membrane protein YedE/YeeE